MEGAKNLNNKIKLKNGKKKKTYGLAFVDQISFGHMSLKTNGGFTFKLNFSNTFGFRDHVIKTNAIEYHLDTPIEKTVRCPNSSTNFNSNCQCCIFGLQ
jgi:hypothetical protein